jgi:hypothetical protein
MEQWQGKPFLWARERDLQAEIGGRLTQVFSLQGLGTITGPYGHGLKGYVKEQTWSRVAFEPYVPYVYKGKTERCHPDIVIWDDLNGREAPNYSAGETWPIVWACELKYGSRDNGEWDLEKLRLLIDQKRIRYGCCVNVEFSRAVTGDGITWEQTDMGRFLWLCQVRSPPLEETANK